MKSNTNPKTIAATALALLAGAGSVAACNGCGPMRQEVCAPSAQHVAVVASTSLSDLAVSREMAPAVVEQATERAVTSCGSIAVGLLGGRHAEADLQLHTLALTPAKTQTFGNPKPILDPLRQDARELTDRELIAPLKQAQAVSGSPFLNGLARVAAELKVHKTKGATVVLIGDGIAVEQAPGGNKIDFAAANVDAGAVDEFAALLRPLRGSCVILVGSGAEANLTDAQVRRARALLTGVVSKAGAKLAITRDSRIPWGC